MNNSPEDYMGKKLIISLVTLPASMYLAYGPPIKSFVSKKFTSQLIQQCDAQTKPGIQRSFCKKAGKASLDKCQMMINILTLKSGFQKCIEKHQNWINSCLANNSPDNCLISIKKVDLISRKRS